jgi:homoserine dehydrogenase
MGGSGFKLTRDYVLEAMTNGKHVIMSSKKALAKFAELLLITANSHNVHLKYDASVGGGIPIAKVLEHTFKGDKLLKIMGIFNATSNYIYSKMFKENLSFDAALKMAQDKGYAENDPTDDLDGYDSLYKLIILTIFGMNKVIDPSLLVPDSFAGINIKDMKYAEELGYCIKPIAIIKHENSTIEYKIGPCLIPSEHIIANTFNNYNTILIEGENNGDLAFYGQGAGAKPTASAMFDDLMNLLVSPKLKKKFPFSLIDRDIITKYQSKLYWRFTVKNEVGVLSSLTGILAENKINIEKLIQKDEQQDGIEIVLLTSMADTSIAESILYQLNESGIVNNAVIPFV